jgi:hypothetical protein
LQRGDEVLLADRASQDQRANPVVRLCKRAKRVEAGQPRHREIEQKDVGLAEPYQLDRLSAVARAAHDPERSIPFEERTQRIPEQPFVVGDDDADVLLPYSMHGVGAGGLFQHKLCLETCRFTAVSWDAWAARLHEQKLWSAPAAPPPYTFPHEAHRPAALYLYRAGAAGYGSPAS